MPVLLSMATAVLIWSLYPLAATIGLEQMSSLQMIVIVYFFSGIGALLMGGFYLFQNGSLKQALVIQRNLKPRAYGPIIVSGIAGSLCHTFFIIALTLADKGGVSLLYESWPIIALIATPLLMKKGWKEVSFKDFAVSLIAMCGVAIVIFSDQDIDLTLHSSNILSEKPDYSSLGGYILAFVGAYMCAVLVVTKGVFSENFNSLNDDFGSTLISEIFSRSISMILMLGIFFMFDEPMGFSTIHWPSTFFIGFMVFVVGGALYTYALLQSDTPTIHVMYYFVPVGAVVWLWCAGEATVNIGLFIGGAVIVGSNIYLYFSGRAAKYSE